MNIEDIKKILVQYKEIIDCKYPNSMFSDSNYEKLGNKDKITLQLFEYIVDYLEEQELKNSGFYD